MVEINAKKCKKLIYELINCKASKSNETDFFFLKNRNVSKPFCGDGIVEGHEDCDCGTIFNCLSKSKNCFPSAGIRLFIF
jgi:hypothetical protein